MITVDTNVLVYAHREDSEFHTAARECIESLREQPGAWTIPWPCVYEFVAIATHPRLYQPPSTLSEALGFVESLPASPSLALLVESTGYFEKLRSVSTTAKARGPRTHDARVAALCLHHGGS